MNYHREGKQIRKDMQEAKKRRSTTDKLIQQSFKKAKEETFP
jgi:hypothetical protein